MANKPHHSQDKWLIEQAKQIALLKKRLEETTQEVYACFCKVLYEKYGWNFEQITALFARTEEAWNECIENNTVQNMVAWCEEVTNFSVVEGKDDESREE